MPHPTRTLLAVAALVVVLAPVAKADHPHALFDAAGLAALQEKRTTTHAEIARALTALMNGQAGHQLASSDFGDQRLVGNVIGGDALAAVILDDPTMKALAIQNLERSLSWSDWGFGEGGPDLYRAHMLLGAAIAYDVLFNDLSATDRENVRARLSSEAQQFSDAIDNDTWWKTDWEQNHNWIDFGALGFTAIVLEGEDSRADAWLAKARADSVILKQVLDLVTDGSWHEGVAYQQYGWSMAMPYWIASARLGVDVSDTAMLKGYGAYRLWDDLTDLSTEYATLQGDWTGWAGPGTPQILRYAAAKYRDGEAQLAANRWLQNSRRSTIAYDVFYTAMEYLAYDPTVAAADPSGLPPDFYGEDQQVALLRSSLEDSNLVVGFKSGYLGGKNNWLRVKNGGAPGGSINFNHDHMDDLGLWIYGDGQWLLPECVGYNDGSSGGAKAWQTQFHNALLFDGLGQLGDDHGSSGNALAYSWFFQRHGDLPTLVSSAHYAFAVGEGEHLYPSSAQLSQLTRTVALARDGYVVLSDDVRMGGAHQVDQLFHFLDTATRDGSWIEGAAHDDRVLGLRVVSPAAFTATITTQTASKLNKQFESDGQESYVQLHPTTATASPRFVELLYPTRGANWASRPDAEPLDAANPDRGFTMPLSGATETWLFAPRGDVAAGAFALTAQAAIARVDTSGAYRRMVLFGAGALRDGGGEHLVVSSDAPGLVEADVDGSVAHLTGVDVSTTRFFGPSVTEVSFNGGPIAWHREGDLVVVGAGPSDPPDAGTTSDVDAGTTGDVDAGATSDVDAGATSDVDAGTTIDGGSGFIDALWQSGKRLVGVRVIHGGGAVATSDGGASSKSSVVTHATAGCGCDGEPAGLGALLLFGATWRRRRR